MRKGLIKIVWEGGRRAEERERGGGEIVRRNKKNQGEGKAHGKEDELESWEEKGRKE